MGGDNGPRRCPMTKRQTFTNAFKAEVVSLLEQSGKPAC